MKKTVLFLLVISNMSSNNIFGMHTHQRKRQQERCEQVCQENDYKDLSPEEKVIRLQLEEEFGTTYNVKPANYNGLLNLKEIYEMLSPIHEKIALLDPTVHDYEIPLYIDLRKIVHKLYAIKIVNDNGQYTPEFLCKICCQKFQTLYDCLNHVYKEHLCINQKEPSCFSLRPSATP